MIRRAGLHGRPVGVRGIGRTACLAAALRGLGDIALAERDQDAGLGQVAEARGVRFGARVRYREAGRAGRRGRGRDGGRGPGGPVAEHVWDLRFVGSSLVGA
ncbi:hypothetical protein [Streptomyces sp. NPDC101234]|uniref:hypothetical protein n=1 Tax=Streptomyces sp. NPDC101234 TaxID=3366138 RepID=UPI00381D4957